jgi:hypothetical protein
VSNHLLVSTGWFAAAIRLPMVLPIVLLLYQFSMRLHRMFSLSGLGFSRMFSMQLYIKLV